MKDSIDSKYRGNSPETRPSLIYGALNFDGEAWERQDAWCQIVQIYSPLVEHWCRRRGLRDDEVADLCQEVFKDLIGSLARFRKEKAGDSFRKWLRTMTEREIIDHYRKQGRDPVEPLPAGVEDTLPFPERNGEEEATEKCTLLMNSLELLKSRFAEETLRAFWLHVEGKAADDIAKELNCNRGNVHVAVHRVKRAIKEKMEGLEGGFF